MALTLALLDPVVLTRDLPADGLQIGDVGTIVEVYDAGAFEVEFLTATGDTRALVTLTPEHLRAATPEDVLAVRQA